MKMREAFEEAGLTEADIQYKLIYLVGIWVEAMLYGGYLCLFAAALPILLRHSERKMVSSTVFLIGNFFMFILISLHSGLIVFQSVVAFAYQTDIYGPIRIVNDMGYWASYTSPFLAAAIFMTGDILVIYRCFLIWQRNYWVILVPVILALVSTSLHLATLGYSHNLSVPAIVVQSWPLITAPYICYTLQTTFTTSLIVYKIYSQYRRTREVGLVAVHTPNLLLIIRIIVESAVIYTAGMLVMVVLLATDHPARLTLHSLMIPITGIVFVLMALRTHFVREEAKRTPASPSLLPHWLFNEPDSIDSRTEPAADEGQRPPGTLSPILPTDKRQPTSPLLEAT
ncbi:hypothetical protein BKA70DRAFT_1189302 [Coprinopsis sp. MPI-PUGE-AT-0042]|nr:hypothetical protein BKA70DRAFT_1189302 [Coprinopsis sp. MPI-PUGE-AT-0042]